MAESTSQQEPNISNAANKACEIVARGGWSVASWLRWLIAQGNRTPLPSTLCPAMVRKVVIGWDGVHHIAPEHPCLQRLDQRVQDRRPMAVGIGPRGHGDHEHSAAQQSEDNSGSLRWASGRDDSEHGQEAAYYHDTSAGTRKSWRLAMTTFPKACRCAVTLPQSFGASSQTCPRTAYATLLHN